jgi:hypothetical protein
MVRRDGTAAGPAGTPVEEGVPCCTVPAGVSPAGVIAGEPRSRLRLGVERRPGQAERRKPSQARACGGEQQRGPQHQVKPAASSEKQSGSRVAHVTAKATRSAEQSGDAPSPGGVRGAARAEGTMRNTRDPSAPPTSGKGRSYKPSAKSSVVQRESEGVVVPAMAVKKNAAGGKGPCSGCAGGVRKRWGMTDVGRSNNPPKRWLLEKAREAHRQLWVGAKSTWHGGQAAAVPASRIDAREEAPSLRRHVDACSITKTTGKPCAGNRHARFERRRVETGRL